MYMVNSNWVLVDLKVLKDWRWLWRQNVSIHWSKLSLHFRVDWNSMGTFRILQENYLRNHYRARNWTFDENHFLVSSLMPPKLHGCIGFLYKVVHKLAVSLCSFSQFSVPLNFQTANALVLKFGTLPLHCLFSNSLSAIFDIFFRYKAIHRFVPKNGPKMTCGRVFQHNFISKANFKNPEQAFLVHRFYLLRKQKIVSGKAGFQLKSDRIWVIFRLFSPV